MEVCRFLALAACAAGAAGAGAAFARPAGLHIRRQQHLGPPRDGDVQLHGVAPAHAPHALALATRRPAGRQMESRGRSSPPHRGGLAVQLCAAMWEEESTLASRGYKIWYSVASPTTSARPQRAFKGGSCTPLPIVVLHGGPGIPSDYLQPLKTLAAREQRKMFFYDQLGCGRSEGPDDESFYSAHQAAEDGVQMLNHFADFHGLLEYGAFHILGHSWGGCLAVEMVLRQLPRHPRLRQGLASVVLSNTPDSPQAAMEAARKLINEYKDEMWGLKPDDIGMPESWPRTDEFIQQWKLQKVSTGLQKRAAAGGQACARHSKLWGSSSPSQHQPARLHGSSLESIELYSAIFAKWQSRAT